MGTGQTILCKRCNRPRPRYGRGLCTSCYNKSQKDGTLVDYESVLRSKTEVLEEWIYFDKRPDLSFNKNIRLFAERIGMSFDATSRALHRAGIRASSLNEGR